MPKKLQFPEFLNSKTRSSWKPQNSEFKSQEVARASFYERVHETCAGFRVRSLGQGLGVWSFGLQVGVQEGFSVLLRFNEGVLQCFLRNGLGGCPQLWPDPGRKGGEECCRSCEVTDSVFSGFRVCWPCSAPRCFSWNRYGALSILPQFPLSVHDRGALPGSRKVYLLLTSSMTLCLAPRN